MQSQDHCINVWMSTLNAIREKCSRILSTPRAAAERILEAAGPISKHKATTKVYATPRPLKLIEHC